MYWWSSTEALCSLRILAVLIAEEGECMWAWNVGEFGSELYPLSLLTFCLL